MELDKCPEDSSSVQRQLKTTCTAATLMAKDKGADGLKKGLIAPEKWRVNWSFYFLLMSAGDELGRKEEP